jgi:hypothetical protein
MCDLRQVIELIRIHDHRVLSLRGQSALSASSPYMSPNDTHCVLAGWREQSLVTHCATLLNFESPTSPEKR